MFSQKGVWAKYKRPGEKLWLMGETQYSAFAPQSRKQPAQLVQAGDAPKWKFLAEAENEQNSTLGHKLNTEHVFFSFLPMYFAFFLLLFLNVN